MTAPLVIWDTRMLGYDLGGDHPLHPLRWELTWALAGELGLGHVLLVCDAGIVRAGYADRVQEILDTAGIRVTRFDDFSENPDGGMCAAGAAVASVIGWASASHCTHASRSW